MKIFLTLKHWQLFGISFGLPIIFQIIALISIFASHDPANFFYISYLFPLLTLVFMGTYFGWFYAVGTNLHQKLPSSVKMNLTLFKSFLIFPVVYIGFICFFIFNMSQSVEPNSMILFMIFPLHLFSMFCVFYCIYFVAKVIKTVESQEKVSFGDCLGDFFLIWFFFIGIWVIQPRINALSQNDNL